MSRIYIFTGKGGVGKSSVATAHAIKSAAEGKKTLLVSTDMAHNLGDIFGVILGKEPATLFDNLDAYEIDPEYVMENDFQDLISCITKLLPETEDNGLSNMGIMPGMEELFSLLKIGETLSLLKFPELLSWYMEKLFPLGKVAVKLLSPVSKAFYKIELPNKKAMNDIEGLYLKLQELQELFKNREVTSVRIVTTPEKMVVEETKRNYMYMNLYNFNVDGLYINRILPKDIDNRFFDEWLQIQSQYIEEIKNTFQALPIYEIPWYEEELKGRKAIERIIEDALMEDVFCMREITGREMFQMNEKGYLLDVSLPGVDKKEMDLYQSGTDVVIKIKNFKRNIPLPNVLRGYDITSAKLEEGILHIQFENPVNERGENEDE